MESGTNVDVVGGDNHHRHQGLVVDEISTALCQISTVGRLSRPIGHVDPLLFEDC